MVCMRITSPLLYPYIEEICQGEEWIQLAEDQAWLLGNVVIKLGFFKMQKNSFSGCPSVSCSETQCCMELGQLYNLPHKDIYYLYSTLSVTGIMTRQRVIRLRNFECLISQLVRLWLGCHAVGILVTSLCMRH